MTTQTFEGKEVEFYDTPDLACQAILCAKRNDYRLRVFYGDKDTGQDWGEIWDVTGRIGFSYGGTIRIPLLVNNRRSMGGGSFYGAHIVKIMTTTGRVLYQHPLYHLDARLETTPDGFTDILVNNTVHLHTPNKEKAERELAFLRGERFSL